MHFRHPVRLLLFAGLVVHVGVVMTARSRTNSIDGFAFRSLDGTEFYRLAQNLAERGEFTDLPDTPAKPNTWRTPGYPAFLAVCITVLGDSPAVLIGIQQILAILNVILLYLVARKGIGEARAVVAGLFFLVEPFHLFYSLWLLSTTLFVTFVLLVWIVWQRVLASDQARWVALLGLLTGLTILIRPLALLVAPALLVGLLVAKVRGPMSRAAPNRTLAPWLAATIFAIACFAPVGGWMLRNHRVAGHFGLSDQGGVVLAYFKCAEVELWRQGRAADRYLETSLSEDRLNEPHTVWDEIDKDLRKKFPSLSEEQRESLGWRTLAQGNQSEVSSFAVSEALKEVAVSRLIAHPFSTALCYLVRCGSTLTFPLNLAIFPPTGIETNRFIAAGMGWLYLVLCCIALARLLRGRLTLAQAYFPLAVTIALLLATTPQIDPRFRVPLIPLLIFMALLPRPVRPDAPSPEAQA